MEVYAHTTERGMERVCVVFEVKPSATLRHAFKNTGQARYRNAGQGQSAWFIPLEHVASLVTALGHDQDWAELREALRQHLPEVSLPTVVGEVVVREEVAPTPEEAEEPGTARPRKRQRRSARAAPETEGCFACQFEIRMLRQCGKYCESPISHTEACGF